MPAVGEGSGLSEGIREEGGEFEHFVIKVMNKYYK